MAIVTTLEVTGGLAKVCKSNVDLRGIFWCSHSSRNYRRVGVNSSQFTCAWNTFEILLHNSVVQFTEYVLVIDICIQGLENIEMYRSWDLTWRLYQYE